MALGLGFQIFDDYLGIAGDPSKTGKSVGNDIRKGKCTVMVTHAVRSIKDPKALEEFKSILGKTDATEEQVAAYGGPQFQVTQQVMNRFAEAVQQSRVDVVPRVVVGSAGSEGGATGSSIMEGLLTLLLSDKLNLEVNAAAQKQRSEETEQLKAEIRRSLTEKKAPAEGQAAETKG